MRRESIDPGSFNTFGALLKQLRRRAQLTQAELSLAVGYSETYITRLEGDSRLPDPAVIRARFIDALHLHDEPHLAQQLITLAEAAHKRVHAGFDAPTSEQNVPRTSLPAQLTGFVGRTHDLAEVTRLLGESRLVTLTGSGGVGKTRLAIKVAAALEASDGPPRFSNGVWLVELAPISDPALVADTVAAEIGLHSTSRSAQASLIDYLRERELLLILDNCEHLIQASAELVEALLRACPHLRILVTSREWLNVPGETAWRVPSLSTAESLQLFAARARAARADFALNSQNTPTVTAICLQLGGIPLAIELAASRLSALSVEQLEARLGNRFQLLTGGSRTALPRHQTLRALIDWSYNLLTENERALLRRLSVFSGGWTAEAAEEVCSQACQDGCDILALLLELVDKSLVVVADGRAETRYHLLETIRQYAAEKLAQAGELEQTQQRYLTYFIELAQTAKPHLYRHEQVVWLDRLEAELDNLRAALEWIARRRDTQAGEQLIDGLWWFWFLRAHLEEGIRWIGQILLAENVADPATRVKANAWMGWMGIHKGDIEQSRDWLHAAAAQVRALDDPYLLPLVLCGQAVLTPDFDDAMRLLDEVLVITQQAGWQREQSRALWILGTRMRWQGNPQRVTQALTQGLALARAIGDRYFSAQLLLKLGLRALDRADYETARALLGESVALARELGAEVGIADSLIELGTLGVRQCDFDLSRPAIQECAIAYGKAGNIQRLAQCISMAAGIADAEGRIEQAARLLAATATARANLQRRLEYNSTLYEEYDRLLPWVRAELDPEAFEHAWADGSRLTLNQALQEALAV